MTWDPDRYERFAAERARPFDDLVARVVHAGPGHVVDLGCGTGERTATLLDRWPRAHVLGIDLSDEMTERAVRRAVPDRLEFRRGDLATWRAPPGGVDVVIANASLQWVPGHERLLPAWLAGLAPGGSLAFQVPATDDEVTAAIRDVATSRVWASRLGPIATGEGPRGASPVLALEAYVEILAAGGAPVDAWETTYAHLLPGEDPVWAWFSGTGLRPYLRALADDPAATARFEDDMRRRFRAAFPPRPWGTLLPMRRRFVVARRPA